MIQRCVLTALGRPDGGVQAAADTDLRKGSKSGIPTWIEASDSGKESQKSLLNQILAVASRQKQGTCAGPDQPAITAYQLRLRLGIALGRAQAQLLI